MDPKDPNFIRDPSPDSSGYRLLTPETVAQLDQLRRTSQIIVVALILGVLAYGGFIIATGARPWTFLGPARNDMMLGLAAICLVASFVMPMLMQRAAYAKPPKTDPTLHGMLTGEADHDRAILAAMRSQVTVIAACAPLDMGAFANLWALQVEHELLHLAVAVVLVAGIALRFPIRSRHLRQIELAVETARLEQTFEK